MSTRHGEVAAAVLMLSFGKPCRSLRPQLAANQRHVRLPHVTFGTAPYSLQKAKLAAIFRGEPPAKVFRDSSLLRADRPRQILRSAGDCHARKSGAKHAVLLQEGNGVKTRRQLTRYSSYHFCVISDAGRKKVIAGSLR